MWKYIYCFLYLTAHKRTHSGEETLQCDICEIRFTVSSYLSTHNWSHTEEKSFQCDIC